MNCRQWQYDGRWTLLTWNKLMKHLRFLWQNFQKCFRSPKSIERCVPIPPGLNPSSAQKQLQLETYHFSFKCFKLCALCTGNVRRHVEVRGCILCWHFVLTLMLMRVLLLLVSWHPALQFAAKMLPRLRLLSSEAWVYKARMLLVNVNIVGMREP